MTIITEVSKMLYVVNC